MNNMVLTKHFLIIITTCIFLSPTAHSQSEDIDKYSFYIEGLGMSNGVSFNFDFNGKIIGYRIGLGFPLVRNKIFQEDYYNCDRVDFFYWGQDDKHIFEEGDERKTSSACSPVLINTINYYSQDLYKGSKNMDFTKIRFELSGGTGLYLIDGNLKSYLIFSPGLNINIDSFLIKASYNPLYDFENFYHTVGISLGVSFDSFDWLNDY